MVEFENNGAVRDGDFVNVKITASKGYVCIGEIV
jgi:hypothetical protein